VSILCLADLTVTGAYTGENLRPCHVPVPGYWYQVLSVNAVYLVCYCHVAGGSVMFPSLMIIYAAIIVWQNGDGRYTSSALSFL